MAGFNDLWGSTDGANWITVGPIPMDQPQTWVNGQVSMYPGMWDTVTVQTTGHNNVFLGYGAGFVNAIPAPSPEELEAQRLADERAEETLKSHLTPKQLLEYDMAPFENERTFQRSFNVWCRDERYAVGLVRAFSVKNCGTRESFCVTTPDVPVADQALAIKLLLENEPDTFFATCNRTVPNVFVGTRADFEENLAPYPQPETPQRPATTHPPQSRPNRLLDFLSSIANPFA